jgi:hypothetical protein
MDFFLDHPMTKVKFVRAFPDEGEGSGIFM